MSLAHKTNWSPTDLKETFLLGAAPSAGLYQQEEVTAAADTAAEKSNPMAALLQEITSESQTFASIFCGVDTAPWYGCGESERNIGEAWPLLPTNTKMESNDKKAPPLSIYTKVGRLIAPRDYDDLMDLFSFADDHPECARRKTFASGLEREVFLARWRESLLRDNGFFNHKRSKDFVCVHDCTAVGVATSWAQIQLRLGAEASACVQALRLHDADAYIEEALHPENGAVAWLFNEWKGHVSIGGNNADAVLQIAKGFLAFEKSKQKENAESTSSFKKKFDNVMVAGCWNLFDLSGFHLLQFCQDNGIAVHNAGVFASGFLWQGKHYRYQRVPSVDELITATADSTTDAAAATETQQPHNNHSFTSMASSIGDADGFHAKQLRHRRRAFQQLAERHNMSLPALSLQFSLLPAVVQKVAIGCATVKELHENFALLPQFCGNDGGTTKLFTILKEALGLKLFETFQAPLSAGGSVTSEHHKETGEEETARKDAIVWLQEVCGNT